MSWIPMAFTSASCLNSKPEFYATFFETDVYLKVETAEFIYIGPEISGMYWHNSGVWLPEDMLAHSVVSHKALTRWPLGDLALILKSNFQTRCTV